MGELIEVRVADMFAECSFQMRKDAIAMSDCCRNIASSAVEMPNGARHYRCTKHRGLIKDGVPGEVHDTVLRQYT